MDVITKSVDAAVKPVESEHPNGEFEVILSTEALDRDDENLWADEWKQPLPARIHIDGDHGRTLEKTVGSAVPRIEGNRMIGKGTYAGTGYAQMVRQLVNEGHINSVSVTYAERKNQKDNSVQRELLNAAFVAIPANPEAVVLASKSARLEPDALKTFRETFAKAVGGLSASGDNPEVKHDAMVQAIHDAAYALGAECTNAAEADPGTDEGANKSADEETSSTKDAGSPQETEESTATAEKAAAAEESAEDAAHIKAKEAEKARALAWLISQNTKD